MLIVVIFHTILKKR